MEAKARYRAVKIQPQWVVTPGKQTNKQTNKLTFTNGLIIKVHIFIRSDQNVTCAAYIRWGKSCTSSSIDEISKNKSILADLH
jgi:hypothetical protein